MRRHYLVSYDVADDKRRTRVFEALKDFGDHTQFSVFLCELDDSELATLRALLGKAIHDREDQALIVDLGPAMHDLSESIEAIGRGFEPSSRAHIV